MAMPGYGVYDTEAEEIARRRQYADALRQQSMQPLETQMAGRVAVPISWTQGAAKLLQAYGGRKGSEMADEQRRALSARVEGDRTADMTALVNALRGTPARPQQMGADDMAMIADQGGEAAPMVPAVPGDPNAAAIAALSSKFGDIRGMAPGLMNIAETRQNRAEDRDFRTQQAEAQREFQMQQLRMRAEDQRLSQQERIAAQRQLAEMQQQGRADMVRLAASMRPAPQPVAPVVTEIVRDGKNIKIDARTGAVIGDAPAKGKGGSDVNATMDVYTAATQGLIDGLENTVTGPIAGRMPAVTTEQQTAEGGVAAMAPVLKQLFRVAGEGVFTDRDQDLLMKMVPTRTDTPDAARKKIDNIDNIVSAKLGVPPPEREWRKGAKPIATPRRRASDQDEPPPGAVRRK